MDNNYYLNLEQEINEYLVSKLPLHNAATLMEISAFFTHKMCIVVSDHIGERDKMWREDLDRAVKDRDTLLRKAKVKSLYKNDMTKTQEEKENDQA